MKKTMKRLMAFALAAVMMLAMSATAFAANSGEGTFATKQGSITIDNAIKDQTYSIYRILDLESYNASSNAFSYKLRTDDNDAWKGFITSDNGFTVDSEGYVTYSAPAGKTDAQLAKDALQYAKDNRISTDKEPVKATSETVNFEQLPLGWYLLDSTTGALCSLDTTATDVVIKEKNVVPPITKVVKEGETWGETNTSGIGEVVNYKATVTVKAGAQNYVLHDTMSEGLTFNDDIVVTYDGTPLTYGTDYTVIKPGTETGDGVTACTFEVRILKVDLTVDKDIVVTYSATVNEKAVIKGNGNPNEIELEYGDKNHTVSDKTITYVYDVDVLKFTYTGTSEPKEETPLAGAKFVLKDTNTDEAEAIQLVSEKTKNTYRVATAAEIANAQIEKITEIETDETGTFKIEGLDAGTYYLFETKAPEGYNKLKSSITVTINGDGKVVVDEAEVNVVKVENKTGTELPSTGGIGTTILYIAGILAMAAAVFYFVMNSKKKER